MNTKLLFAVVVVVAVGAGAVVVAGDLFPGGGDTDTDSFPTATPESDDDGSTATESPDSSTATATPTPPFGFAIDTIEECGQTCRDVTSTLTNQQDATAENVTVYTRIFVGQGTDGDEIWRGQEDAGTLSAGDSYTAEKRVELSLSDGLAVENNGGWITVQTTVEAEGQTVTFTDERQVA